MEGYGVSLRPFDGTAVKAETPAAGIYLRRGFAFAVEAYSNWADNIRSGAYP